MWIGVISDTRGELAPGVVVALQGVDYILHCGNIGSPDLIDQLSQVAPVTGVIGLADEAALYPFERVLFRRWNRTGIFVMHKIGDPMDLARPAKQEIDQLAPAVVLFGHTLTPFNNRIDGRLFFNPGAAGKRKVPGGRSVGILELDGQSVRGEIVSLDAQ